MKNRQIVLTRAGIVAAIGVVVSLLAVFGVGIDAATQEAVLDILVIVLPIVLPLAAGLWAKLGVTPTFDPRDNEGNALIPVHSAFAAAHEGEYVGKHRA